jgi:hypothetical protein
MAVAESVFQAMIQKIKYLQRDDHYSIFYHPLYKYTAELLYDGYTHLIPDRYITADNRILYQYPKIYKKLGQRNNIEFIMRLIDHGDVTNKIVDAFMYGAAEIGNIEILRLLKAKGFYFSEYLVAHASKGNQLETIKWLQQNGAHKS